MSGHVHWVHSFYGCDCGCDCCSRDDDSEPEGFVCTCASCPPGGCQDCVAVGVRHEAAEL